MGNIKFLLANFIDEFNQSDINKKIELVKSFPFPKITNKKYAAYISATVEELCYRSNLNIPDWVFKKKYCLKEPFFVGGFESLKAFLIVESPLPFRRRNIFVSENVLKRV